MSEAADPIPISVSDIIRAPKHDVKVGAWKTGAVPKDRFPLTRNKLSLGRGWVWRLVSFDALGERFVVLVALSQEKEYYRATLAMKFGKTLKVLCFHELHADHWNWHCHLVRGNVHETFPGVLRDKNLMFAWPTFSQRECTVPFNVTKETALTLAAERFRFTQGGDLL